MPLAIRALDPDACPKRKRSSAEREAECPRERRVRRNIREIGFRATDETAVRVADAPDAEGDLRLIYYIASGRYIVASPLSLLPPGSAIPEFNRWAFGDANAVADDQD